MPQEQNQPPPQTVSSTEKHGIQLPSWCRGNREAKTTLSKTGCPVLDELAERIHQSGSCSGHQSPTSRTAVSSSHRASIAQAAARVVSGSATSKARERPPAGSSSSGTQPGTPAALSRSRSFPAASSSRQVANDSGGSSVMETEVFDEDSCSADAVRAAADAVTADDPDFKDAVPYLTTVSDGLKEECVKQLIALKQKLLREFAEVLCLVERKFTLNYAESLSEAREQQTVARYYQLQGERHKSIVDKMADMIAKRGQLFQLARTFHAWYRQTRKDRGKGSDKGDDSDILDIEYMVTEEIGSKLYERKLTAQLSKELEAQSQAEECRRYHTGPPCPGPGCRCKKLAERQKNKRIEILECELQQSKRREQQLLEMKHSLEHKYRTAILRGMGASGSHGDSPASESRGPTKTTTITRRRVDSDDSTLPPARIRRALSEVRRCSAGGGGGRPGRRRAKSRASCRGNSATQTRHLSCTAQQPAVWPRTAECVTSKTLRRPRVRVCQEEAGPRRRVLAEARCRAAAASVAAGVLDDIAGSNSSATILPYSDKRRKSTEVTEKWRHLSRD